MKPLRSFLLLSLVAVLVTSPSVWAAHRIVLLETFTNVSCIPCATANPVTHQFAEEYGPQLVLNLQYHVNWPSATDPFYLANTTDNNGRRTYYGVSAVPDLYTDGDHTPTPGNYAGLVSTVGGRLEVDAPLTIDVTTTLNGDQMTVEAAVTAVADVPASGLVLQMALVEPFVQFGSPPGTNGETEFHHSLRDLLPSYNGTTLTISNGQTLNFSESGTLDPSWQDVYAVVWVQDNNSGEVLQAASSLPTPDYTFYYRYPGSPVAIVPMGQLYSFHSLIDNLGLRPDSYDVHIDKDVPLTWGASICHGEICFPPWITDFEFDVAAGEQDTLLVDIQPYGEVGTGRVTLTVTSQNDPSQTWAETFTVISTGVQVLLVDDDGGESYETYYQNALNSTGRVHTTWDLDAFGKLDAIALDNFQAVVWNVGWSFPSLDPADRTALASYLDAGGRLFITGQDIGWDLNDPSSDNSTPEAHDWYHTYLGATYINDDTNDLTILGQAGDAIGDGLSFDIFGGTGANNQDYPSEIDPYGGSEVCFLYSANVEAGVHLASNGFKSVYFAFGFEGIAEDADRDLIMQRVIDWLDVATDVPGERAAQPFLVGLPEATPNPFNPATHIKFEISGSGSAAVKVAIYDVRGRLVRNLWNGAVQSGPQDLLWNGRSDSGHAVASGVYVARVEVNGERQTLKMTLAK